jgi:hypothetical protein
MIRDTNGPLDTITLALESGQNRVYTITIDCFTGHELSGEVVGDIAVEARHGIVGAYTDIETTPIDLSPYNGSTETFQIRVTAGTITAPHLVRSFKLRVGPAVVAEYGQLTFNGALVTFQGRAVTFAPDQLYFNGELVTFRGYPVTFNP